MSWYITGSERRVCPPEFAARLVELGGLNRYSEPNFKLVWGQTHTDVIYGQMEGGSRGQHTILMFHDIPAWNMLEWKPPETFGTPELWYSMTWDEASLLHGLGDYPRRGFYLPCKFKLYVKNVIGGGVYYDEKTGEVCERSARLEVDAMPLNYFILDLLVPNIIKSRDETLAQKRAAAKAEQERQQKAFRKLVVDAYLNSRPAFGGADFNKSENRERMLERIRRSRHLLTAEQIKRIMGRGHVASPWQFRRF